MREYSTPSTSSDEPMRGNLTDDVVSNARQHPGSVAFTVREAVGVRDVTAAAFLAEVTAVAKGLIASGVASGDRVALMSRTRYEWTLLDYAIWFAGAVSVPIYDTSSAELAAWVMTDAGVSTLVVEQRRDRDRLRGCGALPGRVLCLEEDAVGALSGLGATVDDVLLEQRRRWAGPSSLATVIYTSGTTGRPKGCRLTHGNFMTELCVTVEALERLFVDGASTVLFLPLAHVLARVVQVGAIRSRVRLWHAPGVQHLRRDLQEARPTFLLAVPRVFENVFNGASQRAAADGRSRSFDRAVETAIAYSRATDSGRPGPLLRARHRVFERSVYPALREELGGRCAYAVSGGAPLGERLAHLYRGIGVTVLEGYGLTETTAAVTLNVPDALKIGTVGRPLRGSGVRIAENGELQVRGGQVFDGYWDDDAVTRAGYDDDDGWLSTGDLGEIDDEGFVRVTGRIQEILVTAGGKNVAPAALEDVVRAHPLVSQCLVVGDGRPYLAALLTLDHDAVTAWARARGKGRDPATLVDDVELRAELQHAVDAGNRSVSRAEAVRRFALLPTDWTEEAGQLTPSLKLRRQVLMRDLRRPIERLYGD